MNDTESPKPRRRWYQFSLWTLLVFVTVMGAGFGWLGIKVQRLRNEQRAVEKFETMGGGVGLGPEREMRPVTERWVRKLFGFPRTPMNCVWLQGTKVTDADLACLKDLPDLQLLHLHATQVTDTGLEHLKGLTNLRWLYLDKTQVTDTGLEHLKELNNLRWLFLHGTQVTGTGLEHLKELTNLEWLILNGTQVSDAGLEHLTELNNLEILGLSGTQVTDEGAEKLQQALPNCGIKRNTVQLI